ncbi:TerB family tellurite resistance protein [Flavobacterium urumqiense]|uniref:Tellurite resistance protein TerB n=1 Tax=Flavobacterium urumqiense TaxID=935224 RepID=A0A1H5ZHI8_9FLAO|nr:TerB family tellurite resistance protein [Flavobacterium urumqiense]SEG34866.1 Tellurite resistance protein TerB [Flavobacterium urumqiense]
MSSSEKFEEKNSTGINQVTSEWDAWVGILYSCIAADNLIKDSEKTSLSKLLYSKEKFVGIDVTPLYAKSSHLKTELGQLKYIADCCEVIKEEDKETVFALALEIVLSDGLLGEEEKSIIEVLSKQLKIDTAMAKKIIEVIFLKNKGNIKKM